MSPPALRDYYGSTMLYLYSWLFYVNQPLSSVHVHHDHSRWPNGLNASLGFANETEGRQMACFAAVQS